MGGSIHPLPQYAFMARCLVEAQRLLIHQSEFRGEIKFGNVIQMPIKEKVYEISFQLCKFCKFLGT
jgi:hypothetical protein